MAPVRNPDYIRGIEREIYAICRRVRKYGFCPQYEDKTRKQLIDPMLKALGWDLSDPKQVRVEYMTNNGKRADYAFFRTGKERPIVIVEAKGFLGWEFEEPDTEDEEEFEDYEEEFAVWFDGMPQEF